MATTTVSGLVDTADPLPAELKVDMRDQLAMLDPDTSQFSTMLMKLPSERANSFKVDWLEDRLLPRTTGLAVSSTSAALTISVTTSTGQYFKAGDIIRFVNTGEAMRVVSLTTDSLTVVRSVGAVEAATAQSTADGGIVIVGGSNEQGATLPTALGTQRVAAYNYTQIVRNSWRFTRTATETGWYAGTLLGKERKKKASEHKTDIDFGVRSMVTYC